MPIKGFTFFRSYYEVLQDIDSEDRAELLQAVLEFVFDGVEPELSKQCRPLFTLMRPTLEKSIRNAKNGALGGAPAGNQNASKSPANKEKDLGLGENKDKEGEKQPKNNRETTEKQPTFDNDSYLSCLSHLNQRTQGSFKPDSRNITLLSNLFSAGYTPEDITRVIDRKCDEWLPVEKMRPQLVPWVLFKPENFEKYLQALPTKQEGQRAKNEQRAIEARAKLEKLEPELRSFQEQYEKETDKGKRFELRNTIKEIEAEIEIEKRKAGVDK